MSKNYIGFVNDHSGSMAGTLAEAAIVDYNAMIKSIREAATAEELDTVVSVVGVGLPSGSMTKRQVVVSNPHVLKPITQWPTPGGTPLWDGIGDMIELLSSLPDSDDPEVSMLVMVTTDGQELNSRKYNTNSLARLIQQKQATGRWTFVFRIPNGNRYYIEPLGVPAGNIQEWETTAEGMAKSTQANATAIRTFTASRAGGQSASGSFYADAANINTAALLEIPSKDISFYVAKPEHAGIMIRDFILLHRNQYLKGAAFYQLTKTENNIQHNKQVLIQDRTTGKIYGGQAARNMIGLPTGRNARVHPGDHGNYNIFIQSSSINRKVVAGTGFAYYEKIGTPFTQQELDMFAPKDATTPAPVKAAPLPLAQQIPAVKNTSRKPVKSPNPVTPRDTNEYYGSRDEARRIGALDTPKRIAQDAGPSAPKGKRWYLKAK